METLAPPESASPDTEPELHLLLERDRADDWRRWRSAAVVSTASHVVLLVVLLLMPESDDRAGLRERQPIAPYHAALHPDRTDAEGPEQRQAEQGVDRGSDSASAPSLKAPIQIAVLPPPAAETTAPLPRRLRLRRPSPKPVIIEPPKIEAAEDAGGQSIGSTRQAHALRRRLRRSAAEAGDGERGFAPPPPPAAEPTGQTPRRNRSAEYLGGSGRPRPCNNNGLASGLRLWATPASTSGAGPGSICLLRRGVRIRISSSEAIRWESISGRT